MISTNQKEMISTNPTELANLLVEEEGLERAIEIAFDNVLRAHADHEYFALSIWREVKRDLLLRFEAAQLAVVAEYEGNLFIRKQG